MEGDARVKRPFVVLVTRSLGFENVCKTRRSTSRESMVADKIFSSFLLDPFLTVSMIGFSRSHSVAKEPALSL